MGWLLPICSVPLRVGVRVRDSRVCWAHSDIRECDRKGLAMSIQRNLGVCDLCRKIEMMYPLADGETDGPNCSVCGACLDTLEGKRV